MTEEKKKQYLRKNFIKPLSDNFPSYEKEYLKNEGNEGGLEDKDFASYINFEFDLNKLSNIYLEKMNPSIPNIECSQFDKPLEIIDLENNYKNNYAMFNLDEIIFSNKILKPKQGLLKFDNSLQIPIEQNLLRLNKCKKSQSCESAVKFIFLN
jgi:hypothetical protein